MLGSFFSENETDEKEPSTIAVVIDDVASFPEVGPRDGTRKRPHKDQKG